MKLNIPAKHKKIKSFRVARKIARELHLQLVIKPKKASTVRNWKLSRRIGPTSPLDGDIAQFVEKSDR